MTMKGVMIPGVSAGSNQVGASEMCAPQIISPSGAAAPGDGPRITSVRTSNGAKRPRTLLMGSLPVCVSYVGSSWFLGRLLFDLQLHVLVGRGECPARDEPEPCLRHSRTGRVDESELPDGRVHRLVVNQLLHPVQRRLAALPVQPAPLRAQEARA